MQTITIMLPAQSHNTSKGQTFQLTLKKKPLTPKHNYWLYFIDAEHKDWPKAAFMVTIMKQAFPNEEFADQLARSLAMDAAKELLEEQTEQGRPLYLPIIQEGWVIH